MKKIITFIILLCAGINAQEYSSWKWLHPQPQGNDLKWVKMWDENNWYIVGGSGTFMKTSDGGQTWFFHHKAGSVSSSGTVWDLSTAYFFDQMNGLACDQMGVIMKTIDGGITFNPLIDLPYAIRNFYFINDSVGYAATNGGVYRTGDSGITWSLLTTGILYDVYSPNDTLIIAAGQNGLIKRSTDGGVTFSTATIAITNLYKLGFKDSNNGWVVGQWTTAVTTNGGLTWTLRPSGESDVSDVDYRMLGSTEQVVVTTRGLKGTTDQGLTWTTISHLAPGQYTYTGYLYPNSTDFLGNKFVTVGQNGLINSRTGEQTPVAHSICLQLGTWDVWAENSTGRIITTASEMYSTNGGQSWSKGITNPVGTYLRYFDMINSMTGYAIAANPGNKLFKTIDGGATWNPAGFVITPEVKNIHFITETTGWIVGLSGTVLKTTDGGETWQAQNSGTTGSIFWIDLADTLKGYFGGYSGLVKRTTNGGNSWTTVDPGLGSRNCQCIETVDTLVAFISSNNMSSGNKLFKTMDGGNTWSPVTLPTVFNDDIVGVVRFRDLDNGIIVGGTWMATTTDGGITWAPERVMMNSLSQVEFAKNDYSLFAVNAYGLVKVNKDLFIPVELIKFTADLNGNMVNLHWTTATEKNNSGFAVERKDGISNFKEIIFIKGSGTAINSIAYNYTDNVTPGSYKYRLKQIDYNGTFSYSKELSVKAAAPMIFSLSQNYPNPFNPATTIQLSLPEDVQNVKLVIYNALGERLAELVNTSLKAGVHKCNWNASNISSGLYIYQVITEKFVATKKMMLLK